MYDLVVLGGGPGGVAAAIRAAQLGAKTAIIESRYWGGLCLNRGCIPTKLLSTTQERLESARQADSRGCNIGDVSLNEPVLWEQKNQLVNYFSMGTKGLAVANDVEVFEGYGRLAGPGRVKVGEDILETKAVIVATGADWDKPDFPGAHLDGLINYTQFLEMEKVPKRALILGAGPWALELSQFVRSAGGDAVVAEPGRRILPGIDPEVARRLRSILKDSGITIHTNCLIRQLTGKADGIEAEFQVKKDVMKGTFDQVIYFSRRPALNDIGLETVGLEDLPVGDFLATKAPGVWAIGDVTGDGPALSHRASTIGILAAENALGGSRKYNPDAVPRVAYTRPQVACVGLSEKEAQDQGYEVISGMVPLSLSPMANIQGQTKGMVKVVGEKRYHRLLGVHMLAPNATEIIGMASVAVQMEAVLENLAEAFLPHPTISESLADAARDALGRAIYMPK